MPYLVHYQPVHSHADEQLATIELLLPLAPVRAAQRQSTLGIFSGVLLAIGIAALLSWLLARRITGSIHTLSTIARRIGAGDLTAPVQVGGAAEIVHLSTAVDQMRQQLAASHATLAAETARYLSILETTDEAILVLDADGRVTLANRGAEALLGCARTQVAGVPLSEVVTLHGGAPLTLADIPPVGSVHLAIQTANGGVRTVAATRATVLNDAKDARGEQLVVLRDMSEAVALSQLKDAFLANVTHEFRTPLAALIASLELLRNEHGDLSPAEQQPLLEEVHIGVRRLDTLVQNLLDSASIQAGYFRVTPEVTWLAPLIDEAVELMLPLVRQRAQTIRVVLAPELPAILADDRRIVQVLVNLLSNASKFGPRGDTIVLAAQARQGQMIVAVSDHGPGIPGSRLELWEREPLDLLILDIQLPGIDGLSLCRIIRQRSAVPIIMLTVRDSDEDVVHGLELGADDYLTKPFSPKQLIARARAVLRRSHSVPTPAQLSVGYLTLDTAEQVVQTPQGPVDLTSLEFRLLHYLMLHPGQVVPTDAILLHVWGYADSSDRALLKQLVYRLRQKLASVEGGQPEIETVAGVGYRLGRADRVARSGLTDSR